MQFIVGIILFAIVIAFILTYWQFLLVVVFGGIIVGYIAHKNSEGMTKREKDDKFTSYFSGYFLCVCIFFVGACMADVNLKSTPNSQKNIKPVETAKVEKNPEPIKHNNFSDDEQNFYELKFNEYIAAGIDRNSANKRALANLDGLRKCIEKVNQLSGEEKNMYESKFNEYIAAGIDKNSSIEKAYDDVRESRLKEKYAKKQIEEDKKRTEQREIYSANNYNEIYKWCYWMFYKIGYSDDVLQYHMSNGSAESMRDLKYVMTKFENDIKDGHYAVDYSIPDDIKKMMYSAKNKLQKSFALRKNGNYSEIQQSDDLENEVIQQLIQIQSMLPEGVKYWSYQGIYDPDDDIAPDYGSNYQGIYNSDDDIAPDDGSNNRVYLQT